MDKRHAPQSKQRTSGLKAAVKSWLHESLWLSFSVAVYACGCVSALQQQMHKCLVV